MDSWCAPAAVEKAAKACIKKKCGRLDAIRFRMHWGEEVLSISHSLSRGEYVPEAGKVFVTSRPKHREIHAATFRDRVVHHLLHNLLEPHFEPSFIDDSFACRKGKGTHAAGRRLQEMMWNSTRHGKIKVNALKMDIKRFFPSIHKPTLLRLLRLESRLGDSLHGVAELARTIVNHDAAEHARPCGPLWRFERIPVLKRLGAKGPDYGLPIGNLTSQFFANVYLNALDQFVKRTLGVRSYVRYVDDFVLLHDDCEVLKQWEGAIRVFLWTKLKLEAHPVSKFVPVNEGVDFVGFIVRPSYRLPRRRLVEGLERSLSIQESSIRPFVVAEGESFVLRGVGRIDGPCAAYPIESVKLETLRATWASYEGHLRHTDAYQMLRKLWRRHPISEKLLILSPRVKRRFALPGAATSLVSQMLQLRKGTGRAVLVVNVGLYALCSRYDAKRIGLFQKRSERKRLFRGTRWWRVAALIRSVLAKGMAVAVAVEEPRRAGNVKMRRLAWIVEPLERSSNFPRS